MLKLSGEANKALKIGTLCSTAYLAVYVARNILGSVSPQMIEEGVFTEAQIGTLSSIYFITYAVGQLINGIIGDKVKAKYMISLGLIFAGVTNALFALFAGNPMGSTVTYALTGFALAMIYAPMTKVVAENTDPIYAPRCSLGYTFASFLGSPSAGLLAAALVWQGVFGASSVFLILMGVMCLLVFSSMERKGIIKYGQYAPRQEQGGSIRALLEHRIIRFTLVAMLTGVVRTTVVFWLPTFISQYLGFSPGKSALIYTVSTLFISSSAFLAIFTYERLHRNINRALLLSFIISAVAFLLVWLLDWPLVCIICMVVAITTSNCASNLLWSIYCPSLRDTGVVSGATGFLDFASYIAAAISSSLFSNAVADIGWGPLILVWFGLMVLGTLTALPFPRKTSKLSVSRKD